MQVVLDGAITATDTPTVSAAIARYVRTSMGVDGDLLSVGILGERRERTQKDDSNLAAEAAELQDDGGLTALGMTRIMIAFQPAADIQYTACGGSLCDAALGECHPCRAAYSLLERRVAANHALHDQGQLYAGFASAVNLASSHSHSSGIISTSVALRQAAYAAPSPPPPRPPPSPPPPPSPLMPPPPQAAPVRLGQQLLADPFALFFIFIGCLALAFCILAAVVGDDNKLLLPSPVDLPRPKHDSRGVSPTDVEDSTWARHPLLMA